MNIPGFGFHGLNGNPKRYAVSINGNYRITFGWDGQNATKLDLEDYH
jgi:proteic killer suppression protein